MLCKSLKNFTLKHSVFFSAFFILLVIAILSIVFILSVFFANREETLKYNNETKKFTVSLSEPMRNEVEQSIENFVQSYSSYLSDVRLICSYENRDKEISTQFEAMYIYSPPPFVERGEFITQEDFNRVAPQIVLSSSLQENKSVGDTYVIDGNKLKIVGIYFSSIVHYKYLPKESTINEFQIICKEKPSDQLTNDINNAIYEIFPNADIQQPAQRNYQAEQENILISGLAIIIILFSVVNVAFLYQYVLKQRRKQIQAMQLCGASPGWCVGLFLAETLLLASAAYWLAALIGHLTFPLILNEAFYEMTYSLHFTHYLLFYGLYLLVVLLIFLRFIRRAIKIIRPVAKGETL